MDAKLYVLPDGALVTISEDAIHVELPPEPLVTALEFEFAREPQRTIIDNALRAIAKL